MCELLRKIAGLRLVGSVTLFLDNARYQHCKVAKALAVELNIHLEFLPSYSPNLNLIERLRKFVRKKALYGGYFTAFSEFQLNIDDCLNKISTDHHTALKTLMTTRFQLFDHISLLPA